MHDGDPIAGRAIDAVIEIARSVSLDAGPEPLERALSSAVSDLLTIEHQELLLGWLLRISGDLASSMAGNTAADLEEPGSTEAWELEQSLIAELQTELKQSYGL